MKKSNLMPSIVLSAICLVVALLLSVINMFTSEQIIKNQEEKANQTFAEVLPGATGKTSIELDSSYPPSVTSAYKFDNGYVFQMEVKGYKSGLIIMCGVDNEGKVSGVKHIQTNETFGMEAELNGAYTGDTLDTLELVLATGATKNSNTSAAYYEAIKAALQSYVIVNGGSVDIRNPEKILQDNCNAALGTEGISFTKWFATEILEGVDAVYVANSNSEYVFVIGEAFIGVNADGSIVTADVSEENTETVTAAYTTVTSSTLTKITELPEGITKRLISAHVTASGNYVLVTSGNGYGINGDYHSSGERMKVKICISADGKILATETVYHSESPEIGGEALKNPEFYEAFNGKTAEDYNTVPHVSGATLICDGYKDAIKIAFEVFEIIKPTEGGNN